MGYFTIKQVLVKTRTSKYKTRFVNMERDVLKRIVIQKVTSLKFGALQSEKETKSVEKYRIITFSYPQYGQYLKIKGKKSRRQRKIKHEYDIVLELDRMSINTRNWKIRVGSYFKWDFNPRQRYIKTVYHETTRKLRKAAELKFSKRKDQDKFVREAKVKIRKNGKYLDIGDYNSRKRGINGDFYFRQSYIFWRTGHLFGKLINKELPEDNKIFFGKHELRVIEILLKRKILKDN